MNPGRELDALVAEKVMGIEPWPGVPGAFKARFVPSGVKAKPCLPPEYSTDIAAAWEVFLKMGELCRLEMSLHYIFLDDEFRVMEYGSRTEYITAKTAPHAICLAALKAVGVEV